MPPLVESESESEEILVNIDSSKPIKKLAKKYEPKETLNLKDIKKKEEKIELTTDGLDVDTYDNLDGGTLASLGISKLCMMCNKVYPEFITVPYDSGACCWHCIFFLHPGNDGLKQIEETYQISFNCYIDFCSSAHDTNKCIRQNSCPLCISKLTGLKKSEDQVSHTDIDRYISDIENGNQTLDQNDFSITLSI